MLRSTSTPLVTWLLAATLAACAPKASPERATVDPDTPHEPGVTAPESPAEVVIDEVGPVGALEPDAAGQGDGADDGIAPAVDTAAPALDASPPGDVPPVDAPPVPTDDGLIVHEWGTFTSVQGPDGVSIGGLHHEDEALPYWVHRRNWSDPYNYYFEALPEEPLQQLETPVLYFYADRKLAVRVAVSFPEGIVGQWFPDAASFAPAVGEIAAIANGTMTWDVTLDPELDPATFVPVEPDEIWAPSRRVASTPVEFVGPYGAIEREQFIFYRGLGMFDPAVRVTSTPEGQLRISNATPDALGAVFVLRAAAEQGTIVALGPLAAGASFDLAPPEATAPLAEYMDGARAQLAHVLRETGLTDDEAQAMVDTWTRSWFGNEGLRILYVAPPAWADALLPMTVTPPPVELVRTLVGRIEVISPEEDRALVDALTSGQAVDRATLGRFAEPRLRRALSQLTAPEARAACQALLDEAHAAP